MKKTIIAIALGGALMATSLSAGDGHRGHGGKGAFMPLKVVWHLELTNEQKDKIKAIKEAYKKDRKQAYKSMDKQDRKAMHLKTMQGYFKDGTFDKESFVSTRLEKMEENLNKQAQFIEEVLEVLDDTQTKAFYEKMSNLDKDMKQGFFERWWSKI